MHHIALAKEHLPKKNFAALKHIRKLCKKKKKEKKITKKKIQKVKSRNGHVLQYASIRMHEGPLFDAHKKSTTFE